MAQEALRYYFDVHIPFAAAEQLRLRGIHVVRCQDVELADADDEEHLEYATSHRCTLITNDSDFRVYHASWLAQGLSHAGIIIFSRRFQGDIGKIVRELFEYYEIVRLGAASLEQDVFNRLIEIDR